MITKQFKLSIELVPSTIWYANIHNYYKKTNQMNKWQELKQYLFETEGRHCWICGKENIYLEAHEFWEYDDYRRIQKLAAVHHLCGLCHKIKHIGLWCHSHEGPSKLRRQGLSREQLIQHFCHVNKCTTGDFLKYEDYAFVQWKQRSKFQWKQDLGIYDPKYALKEIKHQQKLLVYAHD